MMAKKGTKTKEVSNKGQETGKYKMLDSWKVGSEAVKLKYEQRMKYINSLCEFSGDDGFESGAATSQVPMKWYEELFCVLLFMFGIPGAGFLFRSTFFL